MLFFFGVMFAGLLYVAVSPFPAYQCNDTEYQAGKEQTILYAGLIISLEFLGAGASRKSFTIAAGNPYLKDQVTGNNKTQDQRNHNPGHLQD